MKKTTYILILAFSFVYILSSCNDTLGINGADYIKSSPGNDTLYIDTMINFKKVVIEKIITKTDTVINYIPVNRTYENVYSNRKEIILTEHYNGFSDNQKSVDLHSNSKKEIISYLDYNTITPELNTRFSIDNGLLTKPQRGFDERIWALNKLEINVRNIQTMSDLPALIRDLTNSDKAAINLELIDVSGRKRVIEQENISGEIVVNNRLVINGQLRALTLNGYLMIGNKNLPDIRKYLIEYHIYMQFPEF
ncbi:hypothetical protein MASR1M45_03610 [Candidatus Kapaibacterium sp.]